MASSAPKIMSVFLVLSLILPNTLATTCVVGGDKGWALGVDLQAWLNLLPTKIHVGDVLQFNFESPQTVAVVDATAYLNCDFSKATIIDVSGCFNFPITQIGLFSFISTAPGACAAGLKLQVLAVL